LISRIWLLCSRMFPSRSNASDDVKLWLPRHKCRICGVEVESTQVKVHYQTTHPEYAKWGRQSHTLIGLVLGSGVLLVIVDALYLRSLNPILNQYIIPAYLLGTCFLLMDYMRGSYSHSEMLGRKPTTLHHPTQNLPKNRERSHFRWVMTGSVLVMLDDLILLWAWSYRPAILFSRKLLLQRHVFEG